MNILFQKLIPSWLAVILAFSPLWASAQSEVVGTVKNVAGEAWVSTTKNGSMGVTFRDNTLMSFGPDTEMTVDEYLFAPNEGKLKLGARLDRGSLNYVSGVIAKLKPDAVNVKTPTGTIGVRGTQFLVKVDAPAAAN